LKIGQVKAQGHCISPSKLAYFYDKEYLGKRVAVVRASGAKI
jgi:hypothetical protein